MSTLDVVIEAAKVEVVKKRIITHVGSRVICRVTVRKRMMWLVESYIKSFSTDVPEECEEWDGMDGVFDGDVDYDDDFAGLLSQEEVQWIQKTVVIRLKKWSKKKGVEIIGLTD